ncbi:MAG: hypothetical protein ACLQBA_17940 [Candidatus Binataceae bacterium]
MPTHEELPERNGANAQKLVRLLTPTIGERIKRIRERYGLTRARFAKHMREERLLEWSAGDISRWEKDDFSGGFVADDIMREVRAAAAQYAARERVAGWIQEKRRREGWDTEQITSASRKREPRHNQLARRVSLRLP